MASLISSSTAPTVISSVFTPKSERRTPQLKRSNLSYGPLSVSRRDGVLFSSISLLPSLSLTDPANAFSFGISGPKEWLKEQKKKSSRFLLAPIVASRESLRSAYLLLKARDSGYTDKDLEEVHNLLRSSARDCVAAERSLIVAFQSKTGVEVCTFKLVVKNASSLLDDRDPVKLAAEARLDDLIRSFTVLYGLAKDVDIQLDSNRQKVADALMDTISSLDKFEKGVKDCLERYNKTGAWIPALKLCIQS